MNFFKLLVVIILPISFFLENGANNTNKKEKELKTYEMQTVWNSTPSANTTHVKIVCNDDIRTIHRAAKNYVGSRNIRISDNDMIYNTSGTSSITAFWNQGVRRKVVFEFQQNEVIVYEEQYNVGNDQWEVARGVSGFAVGLSQNLNTQQLQYN